MAFMAPALGAIGDAAGTAASTVGSALGSAAGGVGSAIESAVPGLSDLVQGIGTASAPSEAGYLAKLGQAVPEGVDLVGPSSTFTGPGFLQSFAQGFTGAGSAAAKLANPSAATLTGSGLGQLMNAIGQMQGGGGGVAGVPQPQTRWQPVVQGVARHLQGPEMAPAATPPAKWTGPIMSMIGGLLQGF